MWLSPSVSMDFAWEEEDDIDQEDESAGLLPSGPTKQVGFGSIMEMKTR